MENNIEKLIHEWRESVPTYAEAKANVVYLTEFRKSKKAILIREAETKGLKTGQERESYAYSHQEYVDLLNALKKATEQCESLRYRMEIARERIQLWKTKQMERMSERKHY